MYIIDTIKVRIASWFKAKWPDCPNSILDFLRFPNVIQTPMKVKVRKKATPWICPPLDSLKFNVDGSARGKPGPAGIGGVLRDCKMRVKAVFSKTIGVADSNLAELLAVQEALKIFASTRWASTHKLIVESDSSNVVKWVLNPHDTPWSLKRIMAHIENFKKQLVGWEIVFIPRDGNVMADALAKSGVSRLYNLVVLYE